MNYSEIPLLRPPKIKTSCLLKTLFVKLKLFFFFIFYTQCTSVYGPPLRLSKSGLLDSLKGDLNIGILL